jgi:hypothetical protein
VLSPLQGLSIPVGTTAVFALCSAALTLGARPAPDDGAVEFARDVRPILARACYPCHGPDGATRQADLRLDLRDNALGDHGGFFAFAAGDLESSEAWVRIANKDDPMPPTDSGIELSTDEASVLRRWIEQGANWQEHWSYVQPQRPAVPVISTNTEVRGAIDAFLLDGITQQGLQITPTAERATLLRRVTFDLTGLPPTPEEVDAFLADHSPGAWSRVLDRLFASPRYGEAMARDWLDAARFGDTHGYHLDNERSLWPWRDWVIDAYNQNKPFDEFTIEQLAGDLLPEPTLQQRIATGFNRCNVTTGEGGLIDAEYLAKYAVDRVDTTATVWLASTLACATCHDHKYDPFPQKDFYRFFAFFNSIAEEATDRNAIAPPPNLRVPNADQEERLTTYSTSIADAAVALDAPIEGVDAMQADWEHESAQTLAARWQTTPLLGATSIEGDSVYTVVDTRDIGAAAPAPGIVELVFETTSKDIRGIRIEILPSTAEPTPEALAIDGVSLRVFEDADDGEGRSVAWSGAKALHPNDRAAALNLALSGRTDLFRIAPNAQGRGFVLYPSEPLGSEEVTRFALRLSSTGDDGLPLPDKLRISVTSDPKVGPLVVSNWHRAGPFDATGRDTVYAAGAHVLPLDLDAVNPEGEPIWTLESGYLDGEVHQFTSNIASAYIARTIDSPGPRSLELSLGSDDGIKIFLNGDVVHDNPAARGAAPDQDRVTIDLIEGRNTLVMQIANFGGAHGFYYRVVEEALDGIPTSIATVLMRPKIWRTDEQTTQLRNFYRERRSPEWRAKRDALAALRAEETALLAMVPLTMVMEERADPRPAHVLLRGQYDKPGDIVSRGVPTRLPQIQGEDLTRLDLATWLVSPSNPLTARVTVNRMWQRFFGKGIVSTPEDFGSRGAMPTHPEMLDWLAVEFIECGWDVQYMQRLMLDSAAYRRSSRVTAAAYTADPENSWLARGPRFRLDAEMLRDQALFSSGLLVEQLGGKSVRPYQPDGVWFAVGYTRSNTVRFQQDMGDALWRRSLYTFWKRTAPPPSMATFDAPSREMCSVQRARTNTPLQALTLLNDVQYVEAARALGARVLREADDDPTRLKRAFRLVLAREPSDAEHGVLQRLLNEERETFAADSTAAASLIEVGDSMTPADLDAVELAAWTVVASTLLNLDEAITRG